MAKIYVVGLDESERASLERMVRSGKHAARKLTRARVLLLADVSGPGQTDVQIARSLGVTTRTVENIRKRCVLEGLEAALERKPQARPSRARTFDGEAEAKLIALACSGPPPGRARWTLELLADRVVALGVVTSVSPQTVRQTLKKTRLGLTCVSVG